MNRLCCNLLIGNPNAADDNPLFGAAHANDIAAGGGAAPNQAQIAAMRLLLRSQMSIGGNRNLSYTIKRLIVPEDHETAAEVLLANLQVIPVPTVTAAAEIFRNRVGWSVEPLLGAASANIWYGIEDPAKARSICYAHQKGFESVVFRSYFNDSRATRAYQAEGRFAAAIANWRGIVRNAGA